ncbi:MAG: class I SAM-dependent methyltransferase [Patescibacteria group bacterium]|jgi:hypothetical protein
MLNQLVRYIPVINYIAEKKPATICEIGSGSYGIGRFLDIDFIGIDTTFDDYSKEIKTNQNTRMRRIVASADRIPLESSGVDLVFSLDTFEHISQTAREQSVNEILRVASKYAVIGFPCGEPAKKMDILINKYYRLFGRKAPLWLTEHLSIEYPSEHFIDEILKQKGYKYSVVKNENVIFHFLLVVFESLPLLNKISSKISQSKSDTGRRLASSVNSGKCYRKIYFIEK